MGLEVEGPGPWAPESGNMNLFAPLKRIGDVTSALGLK